MICNKDCFNCLHHECINDELSLSEYKEDVIHDLRLENEPIAKIRNRESTSRYDAKNREKKREYARQYYLRNKEKKKKQVKEWQQENHDYILLYQKELRKKKTERVN